MFETSGILTREMFYKIRKCLVDSSSIKMYILFSIVWGAMAVSNIFEKKYGLAICNFILLVVFIVSHIWKLTHSIDFEFNSLDEIGKEIKLTVRFQEKGIQIQEEHSNEEKLTIKYDAIFRIIKTDDLFVLITGTTRIIPVFREKLSESQEKELIEFLKSKPTKIKWRKKLV